MIWRGCLAVIVILGSFYGILFFLYDRLSRSTEVSSNPIIEKNLSYYRQQIRDNPEDPSNYLERGRLLIDEFRDFHRAIVDFDRAMALDSTNSLVYRNRSEAYLRLGDHLACIEDCNLWLNFDPRSLEAMLRRGLAKRESGDLDGAIDDFTLSITEDPLSVEGFYGRASSKLLLSDSLGAVKDYLSVLSIDQNHSPSHLVLAGIDLNNGALESALDHYKRVMDVESNNLEAMKV